MDKTIYAALQEIMAFARAFNPDDHPDGHYKAFQTVEAWMCGVEARRKKRATR